MAPAQFDLGVYQEAQSLVASNPLLLRGKHLRQLSLFHGELRHAKLAIEYARRVEAVARQEAAERRARDERAVRFARMEEADRRARERALEIQFGVSLSPHRSAY